MVHLVVTARTESERFPACDCGLVRRNGVLWQPGLSILRAESQALQGDHKGVAVIGATGNAAETEGEGDASAAYALTRQVAISASIACGKQKYNRL